MPRSCKRAWKSHTAHWGTSRQREKCRIIAACSSASLQALLAPASAVEMTLLLPVVSSCTPASANAEMTETVRAGPPEGSEPVL